MSSWVYLAVAILSEVFGSSMLKASENFTKLIPTIIFILMYIVAFFSLGMSLKTIPLGTAYAIWCGIGLILTALVSVFFFGQVINLMGMIGIALIIAGVVILQLSSSSH